MWCPSCNKELFLDRAGKFIEHMWKGKGLGNGSIGASRQRQSGGAGRGGSGCFIQPFHSLLEAVDLSTVGESEASVSGNIVLSSKEALASPFAVLLPQGLTGDEADGAMGVMTIHEKVIRIMTWIA